MTAHLTVAIGGLLISIHSDNREFIAMLEQRYGNFVRQTQAGIRLEVEIVEPRAVGDPEEDLHVNFESGCWMMRRGDFLACWDPASGRGAVRQSAYPYAIDSVMRIIHSLMLARSGGFLLHAASAMCGGHAVLLSGVSGAGKTTIARLAPPEVTLLSDEISYVRRGANGYMAFGTPFAGELGVSGEDVSAPLSALYFLAKAPHNQLRPIAPAAAARMLLRNILFFAADPILVQELFRSACQFAARVPAHELCFRPDAEVWRLIA